MTPDQLESIERQFEKAKRNPQAMNDFANEYAPQLFAALRAGDTGLRFCFDRDPIAALRSLYPGSSEQGFHIDQLAADDIKSLRAERSARIERGGTQTLRGTAADGKTQIDPVTYSVEESPELQALRPFAAMGSPRAIAICQAVAEKLGGELDKMSPMFSVTDSDGTALASVSIEDCERAYAVVSAADAAAVA